MNLDPLIKLIPTLCELLRRVTRRQPKPKDVVKEVRTIPVTVKPWALIVEDSDDDSLLLEVVLRRCGFDVQVAGSAEVARGMLKRDTYDLILVDLQLPGMSGQALMQVLSRDAPFARVVVVTGCPDNLPPSEPVFLVRKPVTEDSIRKILKMVSPKEMKS